MPEFAFHTFDVFTMQRFAGNPLAIVEGADGLSDEAMQVVAREFNLSETIFVCRPTDAANSAAVRIFFPTAEIPFAGHPTIGCAIHLAQAAHPGSGDFETEIRLEEVAGLVPVRVVRRQGRITAQLTAPIIPHITAATLPPISEVATALGIDAGDVGFANHEIHVCEGGPNFLFVPVASRDALTRIRPSEPAWSRLMTACGVDSAYCYTPGGDNPETAYRARMFAPTVSIPEDPATGSASAILAAQLLAAGELQEGMNRFRLEQGYEMGRPSDIEIEIDARAGALQAVRVAGSAVRVMSGTLNTG